MIAVIDYGLGNLGSLKNALIKIGATCAITDQADMINQAKALLLPGVGAAGFGMEKIKQKGLDKVIKKTITEGKPFLGICLGMQLLFEKSEENNTVCLGILKGKVQKFTKEKLVPQIGWNQIRIMKYESRIMDKLLKHITNNPFFYYVNSYYCEPEDKNIVIAQSNYGEDFPAIIMKENITAFQFHPEKSGETGLQLLKNYFEEVLC